MHYTKFLIAAAVLLTCGLAAFYASQWWTQREWFALQHQQLAAIQRLQNFPPADWDEEAWKNALVTPYNVWGNVTYHPAYSKISNAEMRSLLTQLELIVAAANRENIADSVDQVFQLLLRRGEKTMFISGFRDEFRSSCRNKVK